MIADLSANKDLLAALASLATIASALVVLVAAYFSAKQFVESQKFGRQQRIREFYTDYLKDSFERGEFWAGFWSTPGKTEEEKANYAGYVAYMLTVLEEVLDLDSEADWPRSVEADLEYHAAYFASKEFQPYLTCYTPRLQALIKRVARAAQKEAE